MKLLFDQNLSKSLVAKLADLFPESAHVTNVGLMEASDELIWAYGRKHGFAIVSKDSDFQQRSFVFGAPPKVVWIRAGNCPTARIERLLRENSVTLHTFETDPLQSILMLL
jgi:predicted nuclease of predicted toxin-antitoxin system